MLATWGTSTGFNPASLFAGGEQGAWYDPSDNTTMFQDAAGTTPVTAVEQAVGLMLDKRSTAYSVFFDGTGDYLESPSNAAFGYGTNDFTIEFWYYPISFSLSTLPIIFDQRSTGVSEAVPTIYTNTSGTLFYFVSGANQITGPTLTVNQWYHIAVARSGTSTRMFVNGAQVGLTFSDSTNYVTSRVVIGTNTTGSFAIAGYLSNVRIVKGTAVYTANFTPPTAPLSPISGTSLLTCGTTWSGNPAITRNGDARADRLNPFGTGTGNHAFQSTSASRPTLRARYNLLTYSEDFSNAAWGKLSATVTANTAIAPNGTLTADTITASATSSAVFAQFTGSSLPASTYTLSVSILKGNSFSLTLDDAVSNGAGVTFDGTTGGLANTLSLGSGYSVTASNCITHPNSSLWWLASVTIIRPTLTASANVGIRINTNKSSTWPGVGANIGDTLVIWGAQLVQPAVFPSNTYQRIAAATDYATGPEFPQYLAFDGTDDSLLTASVDFTGTDKMTVWSGVSKLNDTLSQLIELSAGVNINNGAFSMPPSLSSGTYSFSSKGTALSIATSAASFSAPITNVLTGIGDISGDIAQLRINGTAAATNTTDQGTGNFGNYALFIGRRNNDTIPFNGRIYSLIVRGAQSNSTQIAQTEKWVASKTPLWSVP